LAKQFLNFVEIVLDSRFYVMCLVIQPLSEGDPKTGTLPPTGSRRLDVFSHHVRHGCSDDKGPGTGTASETERKHEQPEAPRFARERP
jgi:hypothetical protein